MKRCPKCNRTYSTENQKFCIRDGETLEEVTDAPAEPFDPYKTSITQSPPPLPKDPPPLPPSAQPSAPPTPPPPSPAPAQAATPLPPSTQAAAPARKSSHGRLIAGLLGGFFLIGIVVIAAAYMFVLRPMLANRTGISNSSNPPRQSTPQPSPETSRATPTATPEPTPLEQPLVVPPPNSTEFVNSPGNLDGKLADHYIDFSFYYPNNWIKDRGAGVPGATNFAKVERRLPPDLTQENFAVGWYTSTGSEASDREIYSEMVQKLSSQYQKVFSDKYHKISEGESKVGIYRGYEFRFEAMSRGTANGDLKIWGRTVFLPPHEGEKSGATLLMLATSLARELKSADDVGVKGELPIILESFRLGKK